MNEQWKRLIEAERRVARLESGMSRTNRNVVAVQGQIQNGSQNITNPFGSGGGGGGTGECPMFLDTICLKLKSFTHEWGGSLPVVTSSTTPAELGFNPLPATAGSPITVPNSVSAIMFNGIRLTKYSDSDGIGEFQAAYPDFTAYAKIYPYLGSYIAVVWMSQYFTYSAYGFLFPRYFRIGSASQTFSLGGKVPGLLRTTGEVDVSPTIAGVNASSLEWISHGEFSSGVVTISWGTSCDAFGPLPSDFVVGGTPGSLPTDIIVGGTPGSLPTDIIEGGLY